MINISQDSNGKINVTPVGNINSIEEVDLQKLMGFPLEKGGPFYAFVDREGKALPPNTRFEQDGNGEVTDELPKLLLTCYHMRNNTSAIIVPCQHTLQCQNLKLAASDLLLDLIAVLLFCVIDALVLHSADDPSFNT